MSTSKGSNSYKVFKCDYQIGHSAASTNMDIKITRQKIINNQSVSKAIEREGSSVKLSFYKDLSRKADKFMAANKETEMIAAFKSRSRLENGARPTTAFSRTTVGRPITASETAINIDARQNAIFPFDTIKETRSRNINLAGHLERVGSAAAHVQKQSMTNRAQSAFHIKRIELVKPNTVTTGRSGVHQFNFEEKEIKEESTPELRNSELACDSPPQKNSSPRISPKTSKTRVGFKQSSHSLNNKSNPSVKEPQSSADSKTVIVNPPNTNPQKEEEEPLLSFESRRSLEGHMERDPLGTTQEILYKLARLEEQLGVVKEKDDNARRELLKEQMQAMGISFDDSPDSIYSPMMPWEKVSIYMPNDPNYNSPLFRGEFKRPPILEIKPQDEKEIRQLMEEVHERYNYFVKHCDIQYDHDFRFLKVSPDKLTTVELSKVQTQYESKASG